MKTVKDRFDTKYETCSKTGCWNWTAGRFHSGYGYFGVAEWKEKRAHRVSYRLHHGEIPEGKVICHTCDNPGCVNPEHLWLGTQKENMQDAKQKGRVSNGALKGTYKNPKKYGSKTHQYAIHQDAKRAQRYQDMTMLRIHKVYGMRWKPLAQKFNVSERTAVSWVKQENRYDYPVNNTERQLGYAAEAP